MGLEIFDDYQCDGQIELLQLNHFYNMDCMDGMRQFPDNYFDLAIVDPPYGINVPNMTMGTNKNRKDGYSSVSTAQQLKQKKLNYGCGKLSNEELNASDCEWDKKPPGPEYFEELFRVSKNQIIWGGNYFNLPPTRGIIVWDKMQSWENFSQVEMAWTSFNVPAAIFRYHNSGGNLEKKIHPTQKPIILYEWSLTKYAKPGYKILDTHVGSASSLIACYRKGFEFIGFEKCKFHYDMAKERLKEEMSQQNLFYDYRLGYTE